MLNYNVNPLRTHQLVQIELRTVIKILVYRYIDHESKKSFQNKLT